LTARISIGPKLGVTMLSSCFANGNAGLCSNSEPRLVLRIEPGLPPNFTLASRSARARIWSRLARAPVKRVNSARGSRGCDGPHRACPQSARCLGR
jgi:hypothetical protein